MNFVVKDMRQFYSNAGKSKHDISRNNFWRKEKQFNRFSILFQYFSMHSSGKWKRRMVIKFVLRIFQKPIYSIPSEYWSKVDTFCKDRYVYFHYVNIKSYCSFSHFSVSQKESWNELFKGRKNWRGFVEDFFKKC